jgi:trimethylamine:corrinoid methyltransferase-like protein
VTHTLMQSSAETLAGIALFAVIGGGLSMAIYGILSIAGARD